MTRDFTYAAYADLLDATVAAGFEFLTVREFLSSEVLPPRFVVLRHDVTRKPSNAIDFARIEAERDVRGTYYVRTANRVFDPGLVEALEDLGHEVGYCYEDVDRADGDRDRARDLFDANLGRLRRYAEVATACPHDNPLTAHDNRTLREGETLAQFGLLRPPERARAAADLPRFSDAGRTWHDDDGSLGAETTGDLVDLVRRHRVSRAWLCLHPNRWAETYPEFVATRTRDAAVNAAKRGFKILS